MVVRNVLKSIEKLFSITAEIWSIYIKNINMIVFVYRRRTVRELILTGGKVNGKHKGAVLVHGYVDLANQRAWLSF
jgi:hypothetical protein